MRMALMRDRYNNAYYPQRRIGFQDPRQDYPEGDPPYMAARRRRRADGTFMGMDDGRQQYDDGMDRRDPGMRREVYDNISTMPRRYRAPIRNTYDERNHRPNMSMGSQNRDQDAMIGGFWFCTLRCTQIGFSGFCFVAERPKPCDFIGFHGRSKY